MLCVSLSVTCALLGSSIKKRFSSFLVGAAAGVSAVGGGAPGFSAHTATCVTFHTDSFSNSKHNAVLASSTSGAPQLSLRAQASDSSLQTMSPSSGTCKDMMLL